MTEKSIWRGILNLFHVNMNIPTFVVSSILWRTDLITLCTDNLQIFEKIMNIIYGITSIEKKVRSYGYYCNWYQPRDGQIGPFFAEKLCEKMTIRFQIHAKRELKQKRLYLNWRALMKQLTDWLVIHTFEQLPLKFPVCDIGHFVCTSS